MIAAEIQGGLFTIDCANADERRLYFGQGDDGALIARFLHPGEQCLEVGAGIGTSTVQLARGVEEHGRVIAVESDLPRAERLRRNLALNGVQNTIVVSSISAAYQHFDPGRCKCITIHTARAGGRFATELLPLIEESLPYLLLNIEEAPLEKSEKGLEALLARLELHRYTLYLTEGEFIAPCAAEQKTVQTGRIIAVPLYRPPTAETKGANQERALYLVRSLGIDTARELL